MRRPVLPSTEPDEGRVDSRDKPQEHIDKIHPHGMLHPSLAILLRTLWLCWNIDAAEEAEERSPEDEEHPIPSESPVAFDERHGIDDDGDDAQNGDDLGEDPSAVCTAVVFRRTVEIDAIESCYCDGEDELQEP